MSEICQILYTDEYKDTMAELRHNLENKIYSEDALQLTEKVLSIVAAHYTTWCYRLDIIQNIKRDLFTELDWCEMVALENEKNYQIWNYRLLVIEEIMKSPELSQKFNHKREYPIINAMLQEDAKNHHVWSYKKWLVERFDLYETPEELDFVTQCIDMDLRNNSAWTHRFFLRMSRNPSSSLVDEEISYTKTKILECPQNPSSWNYLRGIYSSTKRDNCELKGFCEDLANVNEAEIKSSYALELLAEISIAEERPSEAKRLYLLLAETYDPIRKNYWDYLASQC